jgi:hypothetical protein
MHPWNSPEVGSAPMDLTAKFVYLLFVPEHLACSSTYTICVGFSGQKTREQCIDRRLTTCCHQRHNMTDKASEDRLDHSSINLNCFSSGMQLRHLARFGAVHEKDEYK